MAKHIFRREDEERTELLGHDELFVQKGKGSDTYYNAWLHDSEIECCPRCGSDAVKTQDLFSKTYLDLVSDGQRKKVIQLEYEFYKYRCLDKDCRHVFSKPVGFASKRDNVTFRLENEIAQQVLNGASYAQIANRLSGSISRQAIGQIFNRWVRKKEARRKTTMLPSRLAILSGKTDKDQYTIFLNVDHGIRVYDIVYGVSSADIAAVLLKDGVPNVQVVLSDCNPIVVDAIRGYLPNALHIIPVEYWFSLVYADFAEFAHKKLKWSPVKDKDTLILMPEGELGYRVSDLQRLLDSRPGIKPAYDDFNRLRNIIANRNEMWVFRELEEWLNSADPEFQEAMSATIFQLQTYKQQIASHVEHRELVPERLYALTSRLEKLISSMRTFSDEILKARILYSVDSDLEHWNGVPLDEVLAVFDQQVHDNGGNE